MDRPETSGHRPRFAARAGASWQAAFSLIEVTLAIGIVAFAFVAVFGLLPTGMNTFRRAMDASIGAQIAQHVINDAQQSDFNALIQDSSGNAIPTGTTGVKATRYFDNQGEELTAAQVAKLNNAIYDVNTRILPGTGLPANGAAGSGTPAPDVNVATVIVQVASNPGNLPLYLSPSAATPPNLWTGALANAPTGTGVVPIQTYSAMVSRNQ